MTVLYTGSSGMFSGVSSLSYNGLYCKLWQTLVTLERDPFPAVAHLASQVIDHLRSKVSRGSLCVYVVDEFPQLLTCYCICLADTLLLVHG